MELILDSPIAEISEYELERNKPKPSKNHSIIQSNLIFFLNMYFRTQFSILSELDIIMPEKPIAVPDIVIYPKLKIDYFEDEIVMTTMPITTIEILSPKQNENELVAKARRYLDAGVKSCWIVLPVFKAIAVYSSATISKIYTEEMTLIDSVTGIELALNEVFI